MPCFLSTSHINYLLLHIIIMHFIFYNTYKYTQIINLWQNIFALYESQHFLLTWLPAISTICLQILFLLKKLAGLTLSQFQTIFENLMKTSVLQYVDIVA